MEMTSELIRYYRRLNKVWHKLPNQINVHLQFYQNFHLDCYRHMKNLDNGNFLRSPVKDIQFGVNMVNTNIMNIQVIIYHTDFEPLSRRTAS